MFHATPQRTDETRQSRRGVLLGKLAQNSPGANAPALSCTAPTRMREDGEEDKDDDQRDHRADPSGHEAVAVEGAPRRQARAEDHQERCEGDATSDAHSRLAADGEPLKADPDHAGPRRRRAAPRPGHPRARRARHRQRRQHEPADGKKPEQLGGGAPGGAPEPQRRRRDTG